MKLALVFAMAVGFAQWQEEGLSIGVWYPAVSAETHMRLGGYLVSADFSNGAQDLVLDDWDGATAWVVWNPAGPV